MDLFLQGNFSRMIIYQLNIIKTGEKGITTRLAFPKIAKGIGSGQVRLRKSAQLYLRACRRPQQLTMVETETTDNKLMDENFNKMITDLFLATRPGAVASS